MKRVVVLGGGIAGLSSAFYVRELAAKQNLPLEITIVENNRPGGNVATFSRDGFLMELGAESLPQEKPWAIELITRLGLGPELIPAMTETRGSLILSRGRLRRLPDDFAFFTPRSLLSLVGSGLLSARGIARAAIEPLIPARRTSDDESVASFVERRMGGEMLDRLAQPLVGGLYSADPARLSMNAALPRFAEMEKRSGSVVRALRSTPRPPKTALLTLRRGLGTLVDALMGAMPNVRIRRDEVAGVQRANDGTSPWAVQTSTETLRADGAICALPVTAARKALAGIDARLLELLGSTRCNSIAVVTLAYDVRLPLPRAHGVLVPFVERRSVTAITFSSEKYPNRAPHGKTLLRTYVGGALQADLLERDDEALVRLVREDLRAILGIREAPAVIVVRRWNDALPEYAVGHLERVAQIERIAASLPAFALAGAAYRGVGVSDCVHGAQIAAESTVAALTKPAHAGM
jgi:oxygen-dependent protoporphyrinogen oxidase